MEIIIRQEKPEDYQVVQEVTREAFWNVYMQGCDEHYLAHILRDSPDFIKALDLVVEVNNKIVGSIMFTKSYILSKAGTKYETITFGPLSVLPEYQNRGIGAALIAKAKKIAKEKGYKAILMPTEQPRKFQPSHSFENNFPQKERNQTAVAKSS